MEIHPGWFGTKGSQVRILSPRPSEAVEPFWKSEWVHGFLSLWRCRFAASVVAKVARAILFAFANPQDH